MKLFFAALLGIAFFLVSSGSGQAQLSSLFDSSYKKQVARENAKLAKNLKLSPKQIQAIKAIRSKYTPQITAVSRKFTPAANQITKDFRAKKITRQVADTRLRQVALRVNAQLLPIREKQNQEIENVLTPEQRKKMQTSRRKRMEQVRKFGQMKK